MPAITQIDRLKALLASSINTIVTRQNKKEHENIRYSVSQQDIDDLIAKRDHLTANDILRIKQLQARLEFVNDRVHTIAQQINESLQIAVHSKNPSTKVSRLEFAKSKFPELQEILFNCPLVKPKNIEETLAEIKHLEKDFTAAGYYSKSDRASKTLSAQCDSIGWPLKMMQTMHLGGNDWCDTDGVILTAEEIVASRIEESGKTCSWCEGASMNILMKAASLDTLVKVNMFNDRHDAVVRYFEAQCYTIGTHRDELLNCIRSITIKHLRENIDEICSNKNIREQYPKLSNTFVHLLSHAIDMDRLAEIASIFSSNPYEYRAGWPDLTIIDNNSISFVEVKTTDLLHESQLRFAKEIATPLNLPCSVVKLTPLN